MLIMNVRSHLKYFQSPLFSVFVMCIERGCWLRMHSTRHTINKVSRTNVFYALFAKRNKILLAAYSKYFTLWINIKIWHYVICIWRNKISFIRDLLPFERKTTKSMIEFVMDRFNFQFLLYSRSLVQTS